MSFKERVLAVVRRVPEGRTVTYKEVAAEAGSPAAFRAVGNIMSRNRDPRIPCHRVVRSDGSPGGYAWGEEIKIIRLRQEAEKARRRR
jgi:O-6-methylguanine DNA methyltransferase